jgi:hypothetical protein
MLYEKAKNKPKARVSGFGRRRALCIPEGRRVTTLLRRFKTSSRGGNGFTSLNVRVISVPACVPACELAIVAVGLADIPDASLAVTVALLPLTCYLTRVPGLIRH